MEILNLLSFEMADPLEEIIKYLEPCALACFKFTSIKLKEIIKVKVNDVCENIRCIW